MRTMVLSAVLVVALATAGGAVPGLKVKGDPRAWQEVSQALGRLASLRTYRVRADMAQGQTMVMEFVNPDRSRMVMAGGQVETVRVGNEVRFRMAGGPWQCRATMPLPEAPRAMPPAGEVEVTVERGPDAQVGGERTRTYRYWFGSRRDMITRLYVSVRTGLPRRMQVLDAQGRVQMTMDYVDFNAPIRIELPPCQDR